MTRRRGLAATLSAKERQWPEGTRGRERAQGRHMQTSQPRDFGVLVLVIGLFIILLLVTVLVGAPAG